MWQDMPLGLHWDAKIYNTFVLPVLGYVAQLEEPPQWALGEVRGSLNKSAKGPHKWANAEDLWSLKESFGQSQSFKKLDTTALAAQTRVATFDKACLPRDQFAKNHKVIIRAINNMENLHNFSRWNHWYRNAYILRLFKTRDHIRDKMGGVEQIRLARTAQPKRFQEDATWRAVSQSAVHAALDAFEVQEPWGRIRENTQGGNYKTCASMVTARETCTSSNREIRRSGRGGYFVNSG